MRAFVAVEVGRPDRSAPEHLTVEFLGDVPDGSIPRLVECLRPVGNATAPFEIRLEGIGAFPKATDPRVVWVGVTVGRTELTELARRVRAALEGVVPTPREAFVPHLTLFRVRTPADRQRALDLLEGRIDPPPARSSRVTEFALKESVLGPRGAHHRVVEAFPLSG